MHSFLRNEHDLRHRPEKDLHRLQRWDIEIWSVLDAQSGADTPAAAPHQEAAAAPRRTPPPTTGRAPDPPVS